MACFGIQYVATDLKNCIMVNWSLEHADSFMDKPRLSTLQGMLIVLKARESAPKRGYYFRSWMTVVACVQMAKDLGLDEHYEDHEAGRSCGNDTVDCIIKTRIWQTIFVCELMVGSPQGMIIPFIFGLSKFHRTAGSERRHGDIGPQHTAACAGYR
jgi:hypothetical protein